MNIDKLFFVLTLGVILINGYIIISIIYLILGIHMAFLLGQEAELDRNANDLEH
jgi:hypothetical protein